MTHRIELFFWRISLIEIEPFFSTWVKENDSIFSMTRRIFTKNFDSKNNDPFFGNIDPKNWLLWTKIWLWELNFWKCDSKHWTLFFNMSQRIEPTFPIWVKELNPFLKIWLEELNFFSTLSQRKWLHFWALTRRIELYKNFWRKELMILFSWKYWQQRIELSCEKWLNELNMTLRIEPFFQVWLKALNPLFVSIWDSTNRTFELFYKNGLLKELNPFEPFHMAQRIGPILHDSKNWTLLSYHSKNWFFFFMTQRIEPFFEETQWIEYFLWSKELYFLFWMWSKELNLFCWMWPKELNQCWKTWRIDPFYKYDWELNPFWTFSYDSKKWTFFDMTQRVKLFACDSKNWNFSTKSESKNGFLECDSKNWNFSIWLKELKLTHRIEHLFSRIWRTELNISFLEYDAQNWTSLFSNTTHRIEHPISSRIWLTEFFLNDSQIFFNMTHRIELFFLQMTHRTEPLVSPNDSKDWFFLKWLKELNLFFENITHRIELSLIWPKERIEILWYDTKDWIFLIWLTEPNTFQHNSKNWTFFSNWLKEVNFLQLTQRIEPFF